MFIKKMNTNKKLKSDYVIGIDMDDTIENLVPAWIDELNKRYGYHYTNEDITDWDLKKFYPDLTSEQLYAPLFEEEFWKTVTPKEDAIKYIKKLIDDGFSVYICTNSHYNTLNAKLNYVLFKYFPYLTWDNVIVCKKKSLCKFNVLVDDYWKNLAYGEYRGILYDTPHNRGIDTSNYKNMYRRKNWEEIYSIILDFYHLDMCREVR